MAQINTITLTIIVIHAFSRKEIHSSIPFGSPEELNSTRIVLIKLTYRADGRAPAAEAAAFEDAETDGVSSVERAADGGQSARPDTGRGSRAPITGWTATMRRRRPGGLHKLRPGQLHRRRGNRRDLLAGV